MSVCINSRTSELLLAPNLFCLVCFPLIHPIQTSKSEKSRDCKIFSDTRRSILDLKTCPKRLCDNFAECSLLSFLLAPLLSTCKVSLYEAAISTNIGYHNNLMYLCQLH